MVAAHRQGRPWSGDRQSTPPPTPVAYDPGCYLCPGNERVGGHRNPDYSEVFFFDNDHPCVGPNAPAVPQDFSPARGPYRRVRAEGIARVGCYSPRHDLSLAQLNVEGVDALLEVWQEQYRELGARPEVNHVLVFENRGQAVGVSNPHPHCQVYATNYVFKTIENEAVFTNEHFQETGRSLLGDMMNAELADGRRVLASGKSSLGFMPDCARYAYEAYVAPQRCVGSLADLTVDERRDFAATLREVLIRYDNLWQRPMPYVMALHQAPTDGKDHAGFHFHIELHPPLRQPDLLKFLAGPEIGGGSFLSDTWPEDKAEELLAVSGNTHYLTASSS